ncbi:MAG: heavy-metal-associated domain-containing protein [Acholeplasmatales bacterium]|nr:heavy-metal-associated domain-containing protein [Acholeplasmatales bacterium]
MEKMIKFKGICCANCASKIERKLNKMKGVEANISYVSGKILFNLDNESLYEKCIEFIKKEEPDFEVIG